MPRAWAQATASPSGAGGALRAGGVARLVDPQQQRPGGVLLRDGRQVEMPPVVQRNRHGPASAELGAHGVGRIGHRRVEHGVAGRVPQPQQMRQRRHEFLGADARSRPAPASSDTPNDRSIHPAAASRSARPARSPADTRPPSARPRPARPRRCRAPDRWASRSDRSTMPPGASRRAA